jgi:flavin reductase (DIM6/NTAB) family NADH-FMN oxidoreductase RutF
MAEHFSIRLRCTRNADRDRALDPEESIGSDTRFDAGTFRQALARFPTGVCVLTAMLEGVPFGMTISSFNSLSLDPPLVLFSIDASSASIGFWSKAEGYALNVLAESQTELSERFARSRSNKWEGAKFTFGLFGAPVLIGAAALFECASERKMQTGDHILFIGAVKRFRAFADRQPLVFHGGQYGRLHPRPTHRGAFSFGPGLDTDRDDKRIETMN